jgi:NTE family protein
MTDLAGLARSPLFSALHPGELERVGSHAVARSFEPGQLLCAAGEPAEHCWVITGGLVDVLGASGAAPAAEVLGRLRKGATVGDVAVILEEPYPETVLASIATTALELPAAALRELAGRFPRIVVEALRAHHGRLEYARARSAERELGETVAIAAAGPLRGVLPRLIAAARMVSPRSVTSLDRDVSFAGALTAADDLVQAHATVLLGAELEAATIAPLLREADRVIALVGGAEDAAELSRLARADGADLDVEVVLVGDAAQAAARGWPSSAPLRVIRRCAAGAELPLEARDLAWLARHVTRTKVGLALGAGGAKGYAHIGVLQALEEAGYTVDAVAGSSIGAIVGTYIALGAGAAEIDATLRRTFDPPTVAEVFKTSLSGRSSGTEVMTELLRASTSAKTFADTVIPLTVMAVDLDARAPAPLRDGPLWEALLAATALAGFRRPYELGGHRLVDGLALVPVPTGAVVEDGADVTIAVNLIPRETLTSWPGAPPPEPPPERRRRGVLDDLLEVMDLSQLAESGRHAELADVTIAPRFGPGEWRDFHLADQFLAAGREAMERELPLLRSLALGAGADTETQHQQGGIIERADAVRI